MVNLKTTSHLGRRTLAIACAPLLLLALVGCNAAGHTASPGSAPANTTAPALQQQATDQAQAKALSQSQQSEKLIVDAQHAQKVQALIAKAEASYQSGVTNYNAKRLDAARQDFDFAVDTMLSSGMDLKNDPQLSDEFEQLLSAINSLEIDSLKQGNGFSEQIEEAPAQAANEVTFAPNPELVGKVTAELKTTKSDLPLVVNDYVAGWINAYTNNPRLHAHLVHSLERAGKYKEMIQKILRENGLPQDLIYLAVAESGFQPQDVNTGGSGAAGMWQFMSFRGAYGLERNGFFDERFDPEKSTIAYAKYMKELHNQFGDWYLAIAAYDWGPGRVQHAVAKTGYADFWQLYRLNVLPAETKAYVPSIIAAAIMAKNPKQYGLTDLVPDAPVLYDDVTTSYAINMRLVADLTDSTLPEIIALNPALLRLSTPNDIPYELHIPPGTRDTFLARLKNIPEEDRSSWRFHVVQNGETLEQIASSLHAKATEITTVNGLTDPIESGDELVIPIAASTRLGPGERYKMRRRDTLVTVADRFGVTVEQLRRWNHLRSNRVPAGRSLYVVEPIQLAPHTRIHRRRRGRPSSRRSRESAHKETTRRASTHTKSRSHTSNTKKKKSKKKKSR
ncbi:MAG: transglycosylase SLT domain-containing protein [Acidobacteriaceae bacterium]